MITIKIDDVEYSLKQNLKEITIREYFDIMKIQSKKCEKPVKESDKYVDGYYEIEYYDTKDEPFDFTLQKTNEILHILSKIPLEILNNYPELSENLLQYVESLNDDSKIWKTSKIFKTISKKVEYLDNNKTKYKMVDEIVETEYVWCYDEPENWSFQQWVDSENSTKLGLYYPFLLSLYKNKKGSNKKRVYSRAHPELDSIENEWLEQPAFGNINVIIYILNKMSEIRNLFFWIYEAQTKFPEPLKQMQEIYNNFAGWNDVVVSLSETNAFNSSKGTLYAVRNANCVEVLEFLNWKRGKSFAEYEDYKNEELKNKFQNVIK